MRNSIIALFLSAVALLAQNASVRGVVTDDSGAVVPGAKVTITAAGGAAKSATTAVDGTYSLTGLLTGDYTIQAAAPDLMLPPMPKLILKPGVLTLDLKLKVASTVQQVTVAEDASPIVTPDPANNASALIMRGDDLQALSDDPDDLAADLQALAGPAAGPNGGSIYIDGFSGGQLPSKDSIREIRVNQNPFSPEYDRLGFGRIEIFTKPGTDKIHGTAFYNFGDDFWNSRNPYAAAKAPFLLQEFGGNVGGPLSKRASFFLDVRHDGVDNGQIIHGATLDPTTLAVIDPYSAFFKVAQSRLMVTPRIDYQLSPNNTLVVRYSNFHTDIPQAGVGSFNLPSTAYHAQNAFQTVQATETAVLGTVVNETRFQYFGGSSTSVANTVGPQISVLSSFTTGGSTVGHSSLNQNDFELTNYTSISHKQHSWRFGVRLRGQTIDSTSPQNFQGTFTFSGGSAPALEANNQPTSVTTQITSIERYRRTLLFQQLGYTPAQIAAAGGGASQFSIGAGNPSLAVNQVDAGLFVGDDWRIRPNLTMSLGLRYELQTNLSDWRDIAPRIGIAWAPRAAAKGRPKLVIRAGFGTFYDRFSLSNILNAQRYNGVNQQQYVIPNPTFFPVVPSIASLGGYQSTSVIQELSSSLRAPYIMQSALSVERQLPKGTTLAVTYANSHGLHVLRTRDINAPLANGVLPYGDNGAIFLMESAGLYNQNQLRAEVWTKNCELGGLSGTGTSACASAFSLCAAQHITREKVRHR
jgi:Carboxypeptidase regulatory-like domain